ncbi:MAG: hypothetical protein GEU80_05795 [Dehalococcoidia bacterium]|nr:hypothetical protein [Dehalococcoidia bacterium]
MAVQVYRCAHCGREVLVRIDAPMSDEEIARRVAEEMRPSTSGPKGQPDLGVRLRDDIWVGVSGSREIVPRDALPEQCPACGRPTLEAARTLD